MEQMLREVACAILIGSSGQLLLQQRDNVPDIVYPGYVSLFGGHREPGETFLQCVVREIHEETSCFFPPERFEHLVNCNRSDPEVAGSTVQGEFFVLNGVATERLIITEGSLLICKPSELGSLERKLTPLSRFALDTFFERTRPFSKGRDLSASWAAYARGRREIS
jgi:8-oxo-dGTP diphosphatase